ncbi:carbon-nitrogen hydrolase family protein [Pontibacter sp. G13]|uniref:carbon-nitrogen hydrolase family protein n=1 Tax=Pontibacter sp. G13 TaxID=3074898 RepID=UPI00288BF54C|nr:carbon-nitrogen hydrolase family protein [Pontibacter sp. G13]WNJ17084.1 carbon-nitrogen hydrolase family protein [Pontibacter sp. G13]
MKLALAELPCLPGQLEANRALHLTAIETAAEHGADLVCFPELSLTGYAPRLAENLSMSKYDPFLAPFHEACERLGIYAGVGVPWRGPELPWIMNFVFGPNAHLTIYGKEFLHNDEVPYFSPGAGGPILEIAGKRIALAICYEISVEAHAAHAFAQDIDLYLASVAKTDSGMNASTVRMGNLAQQHQTYTALVNSIGVSEDFESAGRSGAWNPAGEAMQLETAMDGQLKLMEF